MSEQLQLKDHLQPANSVHKLKIPMSIYLLFFMLLLSVSTLHEKKKVRKTSMKHAHYLFVTLTVIG